MRCRCSFPAAVVLVALYLLAAGTAHAQIVVGGKKVKNAERLDVTLSAADVVPGPGDPDLSGKARLFVDPRKGTICFDVKLDAAAKGADTVVALLVHPGAAGEACSTQDCPAPVDLDFANQGLEGCVKKLGKQLLTSILEEPEQFYLDVHTASFPAGAVRGQLEP